MSETYWLVCKEYKCKRCAEAGRVKFFTMYDPVVLKLYHSSLVDDLDVVFTYKCAVSQSVADYIDDHAVAATSFYSIHKHIESNHRRAFDRARLKYAGHVVGGRLCDFRPIWRTGASRAGFRPHCVCCGPIWTIINLIMSTPGPLWCQK